MIKILSRTTENWSVQGRDSAIDLAVEAERWVELGLFEHDIGEPAFLGLAADADVQVVLKRPNHCIRQGDRLLAFQWGLHRWLSTP